MAKNANDSAKSLTTITSTEKIIKLRNTYPQSHRYQQQLLLLLLIDPKWITL